MPVASMEPILLRKLAREFTRTGPLSPQFMAAQDQHTSMRHSELKIEMDTFLAVPKKLFPRDLATLILS